MSGCEDDLPMSGYSTIIALDGPCEGLRQILGQHDEDGEPNVEVNVIEEVYPDLPGDFGPNLAAAPVAERKHRYQRVRYDDDAGLWEFRYVGRSQP